ncbi:MAG: hypothetical protein E7623_06915 [Ruminococcaceae bacterium]|nr:hypothetical protein [Oscillospiraceae bacterium]
MKKYFHRSLCLLMLFAILFSSLSVLGACGGEKEQLSTDGGSETDSSTETETEKETEQETDNGYVRWESGVTYEKKTVSREIKEYDDSKIGSLMSDGDDGTKVIFYSDFEDGDVYANGNAIQSDKRFCKVNEGKLKVPMSSGYSAIWAPTPDEKIKQHKQFQLSAELSINAKSEKPEESAFIGCYVTTLITSTPEKYGDGLWFSFNDKTSEIRIYGSTENAWKWPEGNFTLKLEEGTLSGDIKLDIIATPDFKVYIYINEKLIMRTQIDGKELCAYNESGDEIYRGGVNKFVFKGSDFSLFGNKGGFTVDRMQIIAASDGETVTEEEIVATAPEGKSLGLDITDRTDLVGICYSMWFDAINSKGSGKITSALNVTEILKTHTFTAKNGFVDERGKAFNNSPGFHYWAEPAQGYYRSSDKEAVRNNMTMLYEADVDFIILDFSYATYIYAPGTEIWNNYIYVSMKALLETIMEMREEGLGTPYVVMWFNNSTLFDAAYSYFYNREEWKDCFVYWNDKPLILEWEFNKYENSKFTIRGLYGLRGTAKSGQWSYLELKNKIALSKDKDGKPEQMSVSVAMQNSYMTAPDAHGRQGGTFWYSQWKNAFDVHPKILVLTWWNEWAAQLLKVDGYGYAFVDNFNQEYSRDIEPMKGGHGDQYYKWLCDYVSCYKRGFGCPVLIEDEYLDKVK